MRRYIKENPVTTMFMAGFGIFIIAGYLLVVQPVKAEHYKMIRDMCGNAVSFDHVAESSQLNSSPYEREILDN